MSGHRKFRDLVAHIDADPAARAHVDAELRAMDDVVALAELRERRGSTRSAVADARGTSQPNISQLVSRIDSEADIYLSTLRHYVEALGGRLEITAVFPDQTIQIIAGTADPTDVVATPSS